VASRETPPKSDPRWKWIAAAAAAAILLAAWHFLPLEEWLQALEARLSGMGLLGAVLYCLLCVVAFLLFVPGSILTLAAGYLFGVAGGMAVAWIAVVSTASIAFLISRYAARESVEKMARRNPKFSALDAAIKKHGWKVVGLVRLAAIFPFSPSSYLFGLTAVDFGPYLAATAVGMAPGTFFYAYLGAAGKTLGETGDRSPWEWALLGAVLVATVVMAVILTRLAKKQLQSRRGS
jgi:uncharacterized membrane protein YdjX (TVP38/TMEM64 family)